MTIWDFENLVEKTRMVNTSLIQKRHIVEVLLAAFVMIVAFFVRTLYLDERPFWVDEAESSINALTILDHGYPTDTYLGIPIYENTLTQPWPGSEEYAFRDVSYSDKHVAVYHGWIPLYAIAGSFALHKVAPDEPNGVLSVRHDLAERKRRTRAARLPSVLFGLLFLAVVFVGARVMYGADAAWAGLVVGSIYPYHITISQQARYYSAEVALTTACAVSLWLFLRDCKWKHVFLTAATFTLLFHTHLQSFCTAILVWLLVGPLILRRHQASLQKLATFVVLVSAGTLPWIISTGFYAQQGRIPRAWPLLHLPDDLLLYPPAQASSVIVATIVVLLTALVIVFRSRIPQRVTAPTQKLVPALLFLGLWALCGYVTFVTLIPAVSFDTSRLRLSYWGPLFLLAAVAFAAIARALVPRYSIILAPVVFLAVFIATGGIGSFHEKFSTGTWGGDAAVLDRLGAMSLEPTAKIYAAPNDHLILSFYSGIPIQDITPVRKSFLDSYRGDIVYIDRSISVGTRWLTPDSIRAAALTDGYILSPEAAETWSVLLRTRDYRGAMRRSLSGSSSWPAGPLPSFGSRLLAAHRRQLLSVLSHSSLEMLTRGFEITSWSEWRVVLKYRFVWPAAHSGIHANYAARLRGADGFILTHQGDDTAMYRSRWHPLDTNEGIQFRFEQR